MDQITISKTELKKAMDQIKPFIAGKKEDNAGTVQLELTKRGLLFTADNGTGRAVYQTESVEVPEELKVNKFAFNSDKLLKFLPKIKATALEINHDPDTNESKLVFGFRSVELEKAEIFNALENSNILSNSRVNSSDLLTMYSRVLPAMYTGDSRPVLNGVNHIITDQKLKIVTTDAHIMAEDVTDFPDGSDGSLLVNGFALSDFLNVKKHAEVLTVSITENGLKITDDQTSYYLSAQADCYPDTNRLWPYTSKAVEKYTTTAGALMDSIGFLKIGNKYGTTILDFKDQTLKNKTGYSEKINGLEVGPEPCNTFSSVAFNCDLLKSLVKPLDKKAVLTFHITRQLSPIVITSDSMPGYRGLITPLRLQ